MPKPIIVALDPEHEDDAPLVAGRALATVTGAPLMVLGAYLHDTISNAVSAGRIDADLRAETLRPLESRVGDTAADIIVKGGPSPARTLHDAAVEYDAALVVVGSSRRGAVGRVAPGTTAERLLHGTPCPVLVTPRGLAESWEPKRIGVGFIALDDGYGALRVAAGLARETEGRLEARTAVQPLDRSRSASIAPYGAGGTAESRRIAQHELDEAVAALDAGPHVATGVVVQQPDEMLAELSEVVDLLVCGSRGYGPVRAVLLGGVTHAVVRKAACPVLIVPRGTDAAFDIHKRGEEATTT